MGIESDFELFRKECLRRGFPFDGVNIDVDKFYVTNSAGLTLTMTKSTGLLEETSGQSSVEIGHVLVNKRKPHETYH